MNEIQRLLKKLPQEGQQEVMDFARFLVQKRMPGKGERKLSMIWAGGLRGFKNEFTSVSLQKKTLDWWGK